MKKQKNNREITMLTIVAVVILLAGIFLFSRLNVVSAINNFSIQNTHYGFTLQTPKNWIGTEKTVYSEENVKKILAECKSANQPSEIGAFRFKSFKYPDDIIGSISNASAFSSGAVLEITISCMPENIKSGLQSQEGNMKIGGQEATEKSLDSADNGEIKNISFAYNDLYFQINKYVFVSPKDEAECEKIKNEYEDILNKIISSIEFTK